MILVTAKKCKKSIPPFVVKVFRATDGERFSILVRSSDGMPLYMPTVYSISMLRGSCKASNTINANLQALKVLYTWAERDGINLESRFKSAIYLNLVEIDSLAHMAKLSLKELTAESVSRAQRQLISIEQARKKPDCLPQQLVNGNTAATRLGYICDYLDWLAIYHLGNTNLSQRAINDDARLIMINQLKARKPSSRQHSVLGQREGISHETQKQLLDCLKPGSELNPWNNYGLQVRNELIVVMLMSLGLRRGELLGITNDRINIHARKLTIVRNADDPSDPRTYEPNTKTKDRILEVDPGIIELILHYVTEERAKTKGAHKHKFLFVEHNNGKPLSLSAFSKVFTTLRKRVSGLPKDLTGHVLRHTWNDRFSELCDRENIKESDEIKLRSYQMGWVETSDSAARYTRRFTRERSKKLSLKLQRRIIAAAGEDANDDTP